ncbi:MAG: oxidative damage protection protein [bacterium]|nr:oxidative damage protection protein [bacterium]
MTTERIVHCVKFGTSAPGLQKPPFPGELGQQIFDNVSETAWKSWVDDMMIKVINEYRLNLADPKQYDMLVEQMKAFLGLDSKSDALEVDNPDRGK